MIIAQLERLTYQVFALLHAISVIMGSVALVTAAYSDNLPACLFVAWIRAERV